MDHRTASRGRKAEETRILAERRLMRGLDPMPGSSQRPADPLGYHNDASKYIVASGFGSLKYSCNV